MHTRKCPAGGYTVTAAAVAAAPVVVAPVVAAFVVAAPAAPDVPAAAPAAAAAVGGVADLVESGLEALYSRFLILGRYVHLRLSHW